MAKAKRLPSGSYRVLLYIGTDPTGKRQYKSFTAETAKEAERQAALYDLRTPVISTSSTFTEAACEYLSLRKAVLSPWTISTYQKYIDRDLAQLGNIRMDRLNVQVVQRFISAFASGHSPKTTHNLFGFIQSVVKQYDPSLSLAQVRLPQKKKNEMSIPTDEQIKAARLHTENPYMQAAIALCAGLGLRRGEICAIRPEDITGNILHVNRALSKGPTGWAEKPPKTLAGDRYLTIPDAILTIIKTLPECEKTPYLIALSPDAITRRWERICSATGISCRFYDLRHFYASTMLSLGVPDLYAMQRMGHSTPTMLKTVYQHIQESKRNQVSEIIDSHMDQLFT